MKPAAVLILFLLLAGCAAVQKLQRPPDPEPGRNVWREWIDEKETKR